MNIDQAITAALSNIAKHGDTDIFPFPFERHIFFDKPDECATLLKHIDNNFDKFLATNPPDTVDTLSQVGYTGFRWATQIEPFWNAYYLSIVIMLAEQIEAQRIPEIDQVVFSYRYEWNETEAKLFKDVTWNDYRARSLALSNDFNFVVVADIADFYPRIYHHRLENALRRLPNALEVPKRIMDLLKAFSNNVSYGLPIGGPASRILAELSLNTTDLNLVRRHINFCRYADDYCIFCDDKAEAYRNLVLLADKLFNEGLVLQKNKTKILSAEEFQETAQMLDPASLDDPLATDEQKLLSISIRYDPYSETAVDDYEQLRESVSALDIIGILGREVNKTAIDRTVSKQAINAIRALDPVEKYGAIKTILDSNNLNVLSPVFVTVMRAVRGVYDELTEEGQNFVDSSLIDLYENSSPLLSVELNLSYFIQSISTKQSLRKEEILIEIFDRPISPLIKRQIILIMASWNCHYWLSDIKQRYNVMTEWEKRAFILASYFLGDEGRHWRSHTRDSWNPMETATRDWFSNRFQANPSVPL